MNGFLKQVMVLLTVLTLIAVPCTTCLAQQALLEQDDDVIAGKMAAEVVVRPLGLAATVIGGAVFIVTSPFSLLGGNIKPAYDYLVADPFKFTFNRPLGDY
jgi:hypothetical protein